MEMNQKDLELLKEITTIPSVSGHEDALIDRICELAAETTTDIRVDGVGNVICRLAGRDSEHRLMIFAHLDELGLCVKNITDDGYIKVDRIGGINRKSLTGTPVLVHTEDGRSLPGSVGVMAHHLTPDSQRFQVPDIPDLYVDIGAASYEETQEWGVKVGNPITYENFFSRIGETKVRARALDNKGGCFILLKLLESLRGVTPPVDTYIVFTVQEEFNVRGVLPAARIINPTAAICVDGGGTGDTPDLKGLSRAYLGGGVVIKQMSFHGRGTLGGLIPNPKLRDFVEGIGEELAIPLTRSASIGGLTDASFLQLLHEGIACLDVGFPMRYSHSPIETADMQDLYSMAQLLKGVVEQFSGTVDLSRGSYKGRR